MNSETGCWNRFIFKRCSKSCVSFFNHFVRTDSNDTNHTHDNTPQAKNQTKNSKLEIAYQYLYFFSDTHCRDFLILFGLSRFYLLSS